MSRLGLCIAVACLLLSGCSSTPIQGAYTKEELADQCRRIGGVWKPYVADGYCERR